jgi:hypothetical protein
MLRYCRSIDRARWSHQQPSDDSDEQPFIDKHTIQSERSEQAMCGGGLILPVDLLLPRAIQHSLDKLWNWPINRGHYLLLVIFVLVTTKKEK